MRADCCGDGTPNTVNGTKINIDDGVGIQNDTDSYSSEAEWASGGARCVSLSLQYRFQLNGWKPPPRFLAKLNPTCGTLSHFSSGTLLMDEYTGTGRKP